MRIAFSNAELPVGPVLGRLRGLMEAGSAEGKQNRKRVLSTLEGLRCAGGDDSISIQKRLRLSITACLLRYSTWLGSRANLNLQMTYLRPLN